MTAIKNIDVFDLNVEDHKEEIKIDTGFIQTFTGKKFYPLIPKIEDIDIIDMAHSLARTCRFSGHVNAKHYSVAQHCVYVSYNCKSKFAGLLHDGSEYILQDFPSPLKRLPEFSIYRTYEKKLQDMIYTKFGLDTLEPVDVKQSDLRMLATEVRDLMRPSNCWSNLLEPYSFIVDPLTSEDAEQLFLTRFYELYEKHINKTQGQ